jgi:predicted phosphate transport protein (TIGR00153 family)
MTISPSIFDLFGRSPIKPLQHHIHEAHHCAKLLLQFFAAAFNDDWQAAERLQQDISQAEHKADKLKIELRLHLPKGLFLPVARTDVLELLDKQDKIANCAKDIAGLVLGRKMAIPVDLRGDFQLFLARSIDASAQACKAIGELDELLETGFRGRELTIVEEMIRTLDAIEHDTDTMQIGLRKRLFAMEKDLPPVDVIFLYQIFDWVGDLADRAHGVGGHLLVLVAR